MDEKVEINRSYETLDGDDDVLLLGQATFTVLKLKNTVYTKFNDILQITVEAKSSRDSIDRWIEKLRISEETIIYGGNINWNTPQEGIDCQILKIGSKGWQKGKLQIEINKKFKAGRTQVCIKFCPDEPPGQKSPLDDIRQSEEYKKLSNNN